MLRYERFSRSERRPRPRMIACSERGGASGGRAPHDYFRIVVDLPGMWSGRFTLTDCSKTNYFLR